MTEVSKEVLIAGLPSEAVLQNLQDHLRHRLRPGEVGSLVEESLAVVAELLGRPQSELRLDRPDGLLHGAQPGHQVAGLLEQGVAGEGGEEEGQTLVIEAAQQDHLRTHRVTPDSDCQLSYAIETLLEAPKAPNSGNFLPSLCLYGMSKAALISDRIGPGCYLGEISLLHLVLQGQQETLQGRLLLQAGLAGLAVGPDLALKYFLIIGGQAGGQAGGVTELTV